MPPQGRGIVKPSMTLAEFVTMQERGKAPPKGPAIQPEMSLLAWLAQKGEALGQALGTYDPWALAMPLEAPAKKVASKAASTLADFVKPITAYHGSPHDFDKFSLSKIGTGEGAQAYGHGLYFAENPAVAADYRDQLGGIVTNKYKAADDLELNLVQQYYKRFGSKPEVIRAMREDVANIPAVTPAEKKYSDTIKRAADALEAEKVQPGRTYEVALHASPDDFLDWDKPLSQQSEKVRKALGDKFGNVKPVKLQSGGYGLTRVSPDGSGKVIVGIQAETPEAAMSQLTGERAYQIMASKWDATSKSDAADNLKNLGIKGVRYLDQGSRGMTRATYYGDPAYVHAAKSFKQSGQSADEALAGLKQAYKTGHPTTLQDAVNVAYDIQPQNKTSNYVVFDDSIIDIRKKMALLLGLGGSGAAATQLPQRKPQ